MSRKEKLIKRIRLQKSRGGILPSLWRDITTYLETQDRQAIRIRTKQQRQITDATRKVIEQI